MSQEPLKRDRLFLLYPGFTDPNYPGEGFYCSECIALDGVLASFPELAAKLEVVRVGFERPREAVVALLGEANQSLPALALASPQPGLQTKTFGDIHFITSLQDIFAALALRHGFPRPHP